MLPHQNDLSELYGSKSNPYYVYAPRYIESSAGIKALHFLCHSINLKGFRAYLVLTEAPYRDEPRISPYLSTPILTQEISDAHFRAGLNPIVIYSETIPGNPLGGNYVVRYLMNYVGALGGMEQFPEDEHIVAFSSNIAKDYAVRAETQEPEVLFLPPIDPREFVKQSVKKPYQVVYAGKYRSFVGKPPRVGTLPSVEIYRDGPRMQSRSQVKEILRNATILYSFENSSIVTESILSGTPARFVSNQFLGEVIAEVELGTGGLVLGDSEKDFINAQNSIDTGISSYHKSIEIYLTNLMSFIETTQSESAFQGYVNPINVPSHQSFVSSHRVGLACQILKKQGLKKLLRVIFHFGLRRLSLRFWLGREQLQKTDSGTLEKTAKESGK